MTFTATWSHSLRAMVLTWGHRPSQGFGRHMRLRLIDLDVTKDDSDNTGEEGFRSRWGCLLRYVSFSVDGLRLYRLIYTVQTFSHSLF